MTTIHLVLPCTSCYPDFSWTDGKKRKKTGNNFVNPLGNTVVERSKKAGKLALDTFIKVIVYISR